MDDQLVTHMTESLMAHASQLMAVADARVMIVVETASGARLWAANGNLRHDFVRHERIEKRGWGMKEVVLESDVNDDDGGDGGGGDYYAAPPNRSHTFLEADAMPTMGPDHGSSLNDFRDPSRAASDNFAANSSTSADRFEAPRSVSGASGGLFRNSFKPVASFGVLGKPVAMGDVDKPIVNLMDVSAPNPTIPPSIVFPHNHAGRRLGDPRESFSPSTLPNYARVPPPGRAFDSVSSVAPPISFAHNSGPFIAVPPFPPPQTATAPAPRRSFDFAPSRSPAEPPRSNNAPYDPAIPTGSSDRFDGSEIDRLERILQKLKLAGTLTYSWLELDKAFMVIKRDEKEDDDVFAKVFTVDELNALIGRAKAR